MRIKSILIFSGMHGAMIGTRVLTGVLAIRGTVIWSNHPMIFGNASYPKYLRNFEKLWAKNSMSRGADELILILSDFTFMAEGHCRRTNELFCTMKDAP